MTAIPPSPSNENSSSSVSVLLMLYEGLVGNVERLCDDEPKRDHNDQGTGNKEERCIAYGEAKSHGAAHHAIR